MKYIVMLDGQVGLNGTPLKPRDIANKLNELSRERTALREQVRDLREALEKIEKYYFALEDSWLLNGATIGRIIATLKKIRAEGKEE